MLSEEELKTLYNWVDLFPLSRPKRNINRDFSDAVLAAEIVYHAVPNLVELHNYAAVNSVPQKEYNWKTLNNKVLKVIGLKLDDREIRDIASAKPESIEIFLLRLKERLDAFQGTVIQEQARPASSMGGKRPATSKSIPKKATVTGGKGKFKVIENSDQAKNEVIEELKETIQILETKVAKMEMLVRLKDEKLEKLQNKLAAHGHRVD